MPDASRMVSRRLNIRAIPNTLDPEKRCVRSILMTEEPTEVWDWDSWSPIMEILRLDGMKIPEQVPFLDSHSRNSMSNQFGAVRDMSTTSGPLDGALCWPRKERNDLVDRAWDLVSDGLATDVSGGYRVTGYTDLKPGERAAINGREHMNDTSRTLRISYSSELREVSLTPIGADPNAKIREDHNAMTPEEIQRRELLTALFGGKHADVLERAITENWDIKRGIKELDIIRSAAPAPTPPSPAPAPAPNLDAERAAIKAQVKREEKERCDGIRECAEMARMVDGPIHKQAIDEEWTVEKTRKAFHAAVVAASKSTSNDITDAPEPTGTGRKSPDIFLRQWEPTRDDNADALSYAIIDQGLNQTPLDTKNGQVDCRSGGLLTYRGVESPKRQEMLFELAQRRYPGGPGGLQDILRHYCAMKGMNPGGTRANHIFVRLLQQEHDQQRAGTGGANVASIFTNAITALLQQHYVQYPDSTAGLAREVDVLNFMKQERPRLLFGSSLKAHQRGGKAQYHYFADAYEEYQIRRFTGQFVIDEQDIIDDRLGVLLQIPQDLANAARRTRPDMFYYMLLQTNAANGGGFGPTMNDGYPLFCATHNNYGTTGTSLSVAGNIQNAIDKMMLQTEGVDGNVPLDLTPAFILSGPKGFWYARQALFSQQRIGDSTTAQGTLNVLQDENIRPIRDPRMVNGSIDPYSQESATGSEALWLMAADPMKAPTIEVGYLSGANRAPIVRTWIETDGGQWGIGVDCKHDIGMHPMDWRGLQYNTGGA